MKVTVEVANGHTVIMPNVENINNQFGCVVLEDSEGKVLMIIPQASLVYLKVSD